MIFTLCGSGRFEPWFHIWNKALSLTGNLVFGLSSYKSFNDGEKDWFTKEQKETLDNVHLGKINHSDAILVLNVFGYIGESTMREIAHARLLKKEINFLESWGKGNGITSNHYDYAVAAKNKYIGEKFYGSPIDTFYPNGKDIYLGQALGPGGPYRSCIVKYIHDESLNYLQK